MKIYLYVKTHTKTGLKYFGKTTKSDPYKYKGSGKYWLRHLRKHGTTFKTKIIGCYNSLNQCEKAALKFSRKHKVIASEKWANLREENGHDGAPRGHKGCKFTKVAKLAASRRLKRQWADPKFREKVLAAQRKSITPERIENHRKASTKLWTRKRRLHHSKIMSGRKLPKDHPFLAVAKHKSKEHKANIAAALRGKEKSKEHRKALSLAATGRILSKSHRAAISRSRSIKKIKYKGKMIPILFAIKLSKSKMSKNGIIYRLKHGWKIIDALTIPSSRSKR